MDSNNLFSLFLILVFKYESLRHAVQQLKSNVSNLSDSKVRSRYVVKIHEFYLSCGNNMAAVACEMPMMDNRRMEKSVYSDLPLKS